MSGFFCGPYRPEARFFVSFDRCFFCTGTLYVLMACEVQFGNWLEAGRSYTCIVEEHGFWMYGTWGYRLGIGEDLKRYLSLIHI